MIIENKLFYHFQLNIFVMGLNSKTCWDMLMLEGQQIIFPSEERGLWFLWRHRRCFPVCAQRFLGGGTSVSTTAVRSRTLTWPSPWWWGGGRSTTGSTSSSPVSSSPPSPSSSSCCPPTPERRSPWVSAQLSLSVMTVTPILKVLPQRLSRLVKFTHCECSVWTEAKAQDYREKPNEQRPAAAGRKSPFKQEEAETDSMPKHRVTQRHRNVLWSERIHYWNIDVTCFHSRSLPVRCSASPVWASVRCFAEICTSQKTMSQLNILCRKINSVK